MRYWFEGRDTLHTLGEWPYISLEEAKEKAFYLRKQIMNGIDPRAVKRYEREAEKRMARTFAEVAAGWMTKKRRELNSPKNIALIESRISSYILPVFGDRVPDEITAADVLNELLEPIMRSGRIPTAQRIMSICGQIFRYGVILGWATRDPTRDLAGALPSVKQRHFATITDADEFGALLRAVHDYPASAVVREAMKLQYLTFVRP